MMLASNVKQFAKKHGKLLSIIIIILTSIFIGALLTYMAVRQQVDDANEEIQYLKANIDKELSTELTQVKRVVDDLKKNNNYG